MKKLIIAVLLLVGMTSFAQGEKEKPTRANMEKMTPQERQERQLKRLTSELNLTTAQQDQVKQLLTQQWAAREKMMDRKDAGTKEEMKAMREASKNKMQNDRKTMEDQMKALLTPEQLATYKSNQEKMREKAEMRMKERRDDKPKNDSDN